MGERIAALLVHERPEPMGSLARALASQGIETRSVRTCHAVSHTLWGCRPPHLVFADVGLPHGLWEDVVLLATRAPTPVNVIVVSEIVDVTVYLEALQRGAFDFIVPPMALPDFNHVVRSAVYDVQWRTQSHLLTAALAASAKSEADANPGSSSYESPLRKAPLLACA